MGDKVYCNKCTFYESYGDEFGIGCSCKTGTRDTPVRKIMTCREPAIDNANNDCEGYQPYIEPVQKLGIWGKLFS